MIPPAACRVGSVTLRTAYPVDIPRTYVQDSVVIPAALVHVDPPPSLRERPSGEIRDPDIPGLRVLDQVISLELVTHGIHTSTVSEPIPTRKKPRRDNDHATQPQEDTTREGPDRLTPSTPLYLAIFTRISSGSGATGRSDSSM